MVEVILKDKEESIVTGIAFSYDDSLDLLVVEGADKDVLIPISNILMFIRHKNSGGIQ